MVRLTKEQFNKAKEFRDEIAKYDALAEMDRTNIGVYYEKKELPTGSRIQAGSRDNQGFIL